MLWFCVHGPSGTKAPAWKRSIAINRQGTVFVAAAVGGKEKDISVSTLNDRTPVLVCFDHVYVPVVWLSEHFPISKGQCHYMVAAALSGIRKTLACREEWARVSCFSGQNGKTSYLGFVS